jgi:hypothetical protein
VLITPIIYPKQHSDFKHLFLAYLVRLIYSFSDMTMMNKMNRNLFMNENQYLADIDTNLPNFRKVTLIENFLILAKKFNKEDERIPHIKYCLAATDRN